MFTEFKQKAQNTDVLYSCKNISLYFTEVSYLQRNNFQAILTFLLYPSDYIAIKNYRRLKKKYRRLIFKSPIIMKHILGYLPFKFCFGFNYFIA